MSFARYTYYAPNKVFCCVSAELRSPRGPVKIVDFLPRCVASLAFSLTRAALVAGSAGLGGATGGFGGGGGGGGVAGLGDEKHILFSPCIN